MPLSHIILAILVSVIWGLNFIFLKLSLEEIPPLTLCAIRFLLANLPAIFFITPPIAAFGITALYGLIMFALQFSLLFLGMYAGMTPGMASLIMQTQVFFSIFFAVLFLQEKINYGQIIGAIIAFVGIGVVGMHLDKTITVSGFILLLCASATWGVGNLISKKAKHVNMMSLVIWGCLFATIPMWIVALFFEGPGKLIEAYRHLTLKGISGVLYVVYVSTLVGYGLWNWLLSKYPMSTIVPFNLLIPVSGIIASVIFLNEPFPIWKLLSCILVITGLYINIQSGKVFKSKSELPTTVL